MASCRSAPAQTLPPLHFYSSISQQNCNYPYIINYNFSRHYCPPWGIASLQHFMKRGSNRLPVLKRQSKRRYSVNRVRAAGDSDEVMKTPFNVLITGSSKGIGYALAKEFLSAGDNVIVCSRSDDHVQAAIANLRGEFGDQRGTTCDVRDGENVRALVDFAKNTISYVDIWINNAGSNAYSYKPLVETGDEALMEVVTTNTLGTMICCREAIMMMMGQPRGGHIFNIDGAGADGSPTPRFAAYGATKRSLVHLTKSLQAELRMQGIKKVAVHNLSPGMVTTDLLMSGSNTKQVCLSSLHSNEGKVLHQCSCGTSRHGWSDLLALRFAQVYARLLGLEEIRALLSGKFVAQICNLVMSYLSLREGFESLWP